MHFGVVLGDLVAMGTGPDIEGVHRPLDLIPQDIRKTSSAGNLPASLRHLLLHHGLMLLVFVVLGITMSHLET